MKTKTDVQDRASRAGRGRLRYPIQRQVEQKILSNDQKPQGREKTVAGAT